VDGQLQAASFYETLLDDPEGCWITVLVDPAYRRRGLGTALASHAEALAASEGHTKLITYAPSGTGEGERIDSPTGFGSVPASNPEVRFLLANGYRLEQVERASRLALPIDVTVPEPAAGYRLHFWQDHTPEEWLEDMALMFTRMSTDAPSAGLDEPEDVYTVERVLEFEAAADASPRTQLVVVVEHIASGRLAGYSELRVPVEASRAVGQGDTLVLREHRGHQLGMLMKAANLERLQREWPGHPSVITHNAEENRFMLDVNEAVGFVPIGYEGAWRKDL
jgi:GNAT superfamily N-acetyltransferase